MQHWHWLPKRQEPQLHDSDFPQKDNTLQAASPFQRSRGGASLPSPVGPASHRRPGTESHRLTHSCFKGRSDFTQTGAQGPGWEDWVEGVGVSPRVSGQNEDDGCGGICPITAIASV